MIMVKLILKNQLLFKNIFVRKRMLKWFKLSKTKHVIFTCLSNVFNIGYELSSPFSSLLHFDTLKLPLSK